MSLVLFRQDFIIHIWRLCLVQELRSEVENLASRVLYMQEAKEDVRSDIAVMKRAAEKAHGEVTEAEQLKKKQVRWILTEIILLPYIYRQWLTIMSCINSCIFHRRDGIVNFHCRSFLQDFLVDRLTQKVDRLHEEIAMYEAQAFAQEEETRSAQKTLSEAITEIEVLWPL